jgi:hypothetical protein
VQRAARCSGKACACIPQFAPGYTPRGARSAVHHQSGPDERPNRSSCNATIHGGPPVPPGVAAGLPVRRSTGSVTPSGVVFWLFSWRVVLSSPAIVPPHKAMANARRIAIAPSGSVATQLTSDAGSPCPESRVADVNRGDGGRDRRRGWNNACSRVANAASMSFHR